MCPQSSQWACCAARPTSRPFPGRQAPTKTITRRASSPSPPNCTLLHAPLASQGGLDSSDHSSRDPPISDGTRAWVADSFVEGQPLSDRRKVARRRALTMDLTGRPASQARLHLVVGRLHQAPESPLLARGPARLRRRLVRRRVSPSHGPPGALRASVCVLVVGQSAKFWRRFLREERVCIYVYVFTNNVHDHELREQTNEPEGRLHEKRDQTSAPRTNNQTRRVCSCSANRFANK